MAETPPPAVQDGPDLAATIQELLPEETADFGWVIHKPHVGDHFLITCDVSEFWRAMPGQAARMAVAQHVRAWAQLLEPVLGVVEWGREGQIEVLVVATDQATADLEAKLTIAYLEGLNPPPAAGPECGCPERGWHLISCVHDGKPLPEREEWAA